MREKKAKLGDMTMVFSYLFLLIIIGGGIALGAYAFVGKGYNVRGEEAVILADKIKDCVNSGVDWNDFYAECEINKEVAEKSLVLGVKINGEEIFSINKGKVEGCRFIGARENPSYPVSAFMEFLNEGERYEITAGSIQKIRRVIK